MFLPFYCLCLSFKLHCRFLLFFFTPVTTSKEFFNDIKRANMQCIFLVTFDECDSHVADFSNKSNKTWFPDKGVINVDHYYDINNCSPWHSNSAVTLIYSYKQRFGPGYSIIFCSRKFWSGASSVQLIISVVYPGMVSKWVRQCPRDGLFSYLFVEFRYIQKK